MSCLAPTQAWQDRAEKGSRLLWSLKDLDPAEYFYNSAGEFVSSRYRVLTIPCGKCLLCRKSRSWEVTIRALMEFQALPPDRRKGCFVTLTVSDEFMPDVFPGMKLRHKPFQDFMKRIRRKCERELYGFGRDVPKYARRSLRFLMCGEYGEKSKRPHYHVCFFGEDFSEKFCDVNVCRTLANIGSSSLVNNFSPERRTGRFYSDGSHCDSPFIAECWPFGQIMCRSLNDNAIAYTAGYTLKLDGEVFEDDFCDDSPFLVSDIPKKFKDDPKDKKQKLPQARVDVKIHNYCKWSRRPGLGYEYMRKYPSLFRLQHERCEDGFEIPSICPSIVWKGKQVFFDGRYFKTKLALTDPKKYETMMTLSESRSFLKALHNTDMSAKVKASNLKNRAAQIERKLAGKSRDLSGIIGDELTGGIIP